MVTSRADRRAGQEPRAREAFGAHAGLVSAAHLTVLDFRDLRVSADARRVQG